MHYLFYVLIAAPMFAIRDLIHKYGLNNETNIILFTCMWITIAGIFALSYLLYNFINYPKNVKIINRSNIFYSTIVAILGLIGYLVYFKAIKLCSNPEIVRSLFSALLIILIILFSIYKNNYLKIHQYIGVIFVLIGMFLAYNKNLKLF